MKFISCIQKLHNIFYIILNRLDKLINIESTNIIDQNQVSYDIKDKRFALPDMNPITDQMFNRLETIKNNNYLLPVAEEEPRKIIKPITFINEG